MRTDPTFSTKHGIGTGFVNRWILKSPIKAPLIGTAVGAGLIAAALLTASAIGWTLMLPGGILLLTFVPLLIVGLVRKGFKASRKPARKQLPEEPMEADKLTRGEAVTRFKRRMERAAEDEIRQRQRR